MTKFSTHFQKLMDAKNPVGEVVAVNKFIVRVEGLHPINIHSLVMFEDGSKGYVNEINDQEVIILHLGTKEIRVGMVVVLQHHQLLTKVGKDFIGRIVSVTGEPLDGKGPIPASAAWPIFNRATNINERQLLSDQLETGVLAIDSLFPIVRGQRMALLGDSKSGKSTLVSQIALNQKNTDQIVVYCLIAKRKIDIDEIIIRLTDNGAIEKAIVIVATMFDSLVINYLAPYVACSIAEYLWQKCNQDTIIIYDDLTAHAHTYREISLLSGSSPGRDSYPGDMFFAHSRLLERAGRINMNGNALTAIPVAHVPNGDITSYLPTNLMSITDGQWILDMDIFRNGIRPALNLGLSVTRAGGLGHNDRQKKIAVATLKVLGEYREAKEFSHFGSELSDSAKRALYIGELIDQVLNQPPSQVFNLMDQQIILSAILSLNLGDRILINKLKKEVRDYSSKVTDDASFETIFKDVSKEFIKVIPRKTSSQPEPVNNGAEK